ncbi:hypothetical protein ACC731_37895, partial [Rhizobium ruizarguesonis]
IAVSASVRDQVGSRLNLGFEFIGELAGAWDERAMPQSLAEKRVALIVDDGGWRNTTAFDLGIQAMGGICVHVPISFNTREETS